MSICDDDLEGIIKEILILRVSTSHILAILYGCSIQVNWTLYPTDRKATSL